MRADDALSTIIKSRDAKLQQIVSFYEARASSGVSHDQELHDAKLALYSFRRDSSSAQAQKVEWQAKIVALEEAVEALVKNQYSSAIVDSATVWRAEDTTLAARQKLAELKNVK